MSTFDRVELFATAPAPLPADRSDSLPDFDDHDFDDDIEDLDDDFDDLNCGRTPDGRCQLAGTEWCDWSCPIGNARPRGRG